jgi:hypothetical protein
MFLKDFGSGTYATYGIFRILEVIITISTRDFNWLLSDKSKNESFKKLQVVQVIIESKVLQFMAIFFVSRFGVYRLYSTESFLFPKHVG